MLYWCCLCDQNIDRPALTGQPRRWLSQGEWEQYRSFPVFRRQKDWLAGRLAAKRVLQAALQDATGQAPEMSSICITNDSSGAPLPCLEDQPEFNYEEFPYHLSISHRDGRGLAAVTTREQGPLGADLEKIEPRMEGFADEFFSCEEMDWLDNKPASALDIWNTAVWSAKEAALKALGLGLTIDTRSLSIEPADPDGDLDRNWLPFRVGWDPKRWSAYFERQKSKPHILKSTHFQNLSDLPVLKGYWRRNDGYILTLAYSGQESPTFEEVKQVW